MQVLDRYNQFEDLLKDQFAEAGSKTLIQSLVTHMMRGAATLYEGSVLSGLKFNGIQRRRHMGAATAAFHKHTKGVPHSDKAPSSWVHPALLREAQA